MGLTDMSLIKQLEHSGCFGKAYDPTEKACKMCDLARECAFESEKNTSILDLLVLKPETQAALDEDQERRDEKVKASEARKKKRPPGMPDPKKMTNGEIEDLVRERGGVVKQYDDPKIYRMRLVMALTETYCS